MKCYFCGKDMIWYMDTLLCPVCNREVILELKFDYDYKNGKYSIEQIKEWNK